MSQQEQVGREVLPIPNRKHVGVTTYDAKDPDTYFPPIEPLRPPKGAPNVLVILLDDVGFGASSAFGGPCQTRVAERLATGGLKYNRFHTTALCSPTRQALLTGRNHHSVGIGGITEIATSAPGYSSIRPLDAAPLAETLKLNGYSTAQFGKCHEVPVWQTSPMGPFGQWPTGSGFEYFYGFVCAETNQFYPNLTEGTTPIETPKTPEEGYHLTEDMTNKTIKWMHQQKALLSDKPFFIYYAPGATHAPHQVAPEWSDKYKGQFSQGWDKLREETLARQKELGAIPPDVELTERHDQIPAWDEMPDELKPILEPMDTPYQWTKQVASHWGGTRNGTIVHWPKGFESKGEIRSQFFHVIDVAPTILEAAGLPEPTFVNGIQQKPYEGFSMVETFDDADTVEAHSTQYFEIIGNRGLYHKGWTACTQHRIPWLTGAVELPAFDDDVWELYAPDDWSQAHDLAAEMPEKLHELQRLWLIEATKYNVLPLDDRGTERLNPDIAGRPQLIRGKRQLLYGGMGRLSEYTVLNIKNRSYAITAEVTVPEGGAEGVIVAQGGITGGWSIYVKEGKPKYCYNFVGLNQTFVEGEMVLPSGTHQVRMEFAYDGGGLGKGGAVTLYIDGDKIGQGRVEQTEPFVFSVDETCDIGIDDASVVSSDYPPKTNRFNGEVNWVEIDIDEAAEDFDHLVTPEERFRVAMGRQ